MFARRALSLSAALVLGTAPAGCHHGPSPPRIALLAGQDGLGPGTLSAQAASGLASCAAASGATASASSASPPSDYEGGLALLATESFDPIVAVGPEMAPAVAAAARRFGDTHFDVIDASVAAPNVTSVRFADEQGAYVAGALAALTSRSKRVAFLGGLPLDRLAPVRAGFEAGVREVDPAVHASAAYAGSFSNEEAGRRAARALAAAGADVVYVVAGRAGLGAIAELRARHRYAVGVDSDQDAVAPGTVLASVVKRYDVAAGDLCWEAVSQKTTVGELRLGLASGAIGLTRSPFARAVVTPRILARLARIESAIAGGTIVVPGGVTASAPVPQRRNAPAAR